MVGSLRRLFLIGLALCGLVVAQLPATATYAWPPCSVPRVTEAVPASRCSPELSGAGLPLAVVQPSKSGYLEDVWHGIRDTSKTILKWLGILIGFVLIIVLIRLAGRAVRSQRSAKSGVGISLEDLGASASARLDSNRALGRELAVAISTVSQGPITEPRPELDVSKDLDGGVSLNVRVAGEELAAIDAYLQDGAALKLGPVSITPRQVVGFLGMTFAPKYEYELGGYLATSQSESTLAVELRHDKQPPVRWSCACNGAGAREQAVVGVARRVVFQTSSARISESWPSVSAYREARAKLAPLTGRGDRSTELEEVRRMLERSLAFDPVNILARFDLATVLRKLGANDEAVAQYEFLDSLLDSGAHGDSPALRRTVAYSRASALSKVDRWDTPNQAIQLLVALGAQVGGDGELSALERERLLLLIRSAWSAAKLFEAERLRSSDLDDRTKARRAKLLGDLEEVRDWVAGSTKRQPQVDWTTYVQARAVVENAFGRALYLSRRRDQAVAIFERALTYVPDLGDAHVNIASVLVHSKSTMPNWYERALRHLDLALEQSPWDRKALYLRGQLHYEAGEIDDARKDWEVAGEAGDRFAHRWLAELDWQKGDRTGAIERLRRSMARDPAQDGRTKMLVIWTADLLKRNGAIGPRGLADARTAGRLLERQAEKDGKRLSASLTTAIAALDQASRNKGHAPEPEPAAEELGHAPEPEPAAEEKGHAPEPEPAADAPLGAA